MAFAKRDHLARAVSTVVKNDNCSGCGGCALVSSRITMTLSEEGYMRPQLSESSSVGGIEDRREAQLFQAMCPGNRLTAPRSEPIGRRHPVFGDYVSAWASMATDPKVRKSGSSAGVLTALSAWLLETRTATTVDAAAGSSASPMRTVPFRVVGPKDVAATAGSRYAPVATLSGWNDAPGSAFVGKPCEVSAAVQFHEASGSRSELPVLLSFFCAGTPSQLATEGLVKSLDIDPEQVMSVRYRGNGWPGRFEVRAQGGVKASLSYEESWGNHLGRQLQWRCKLCVDGTGAHADVSVGDFWNADGRGYPDFHDAPGNSVAIARTSRGDELLRAAAAAGVIAIAPVELEIVAAIQPLQVERRETIEGRLAGRLLAGRRVPRYRGYRLTPLALRRLLANARAAVGTFLRSTGLRR
jgi:coenzyme F420 hydrogenase subunit beta